MMRLWDLASEGPQKLDGSTGLLDLDFIFIFRVIDFKSRDKDDHSDGTLFQSDGKALSVYRMALERYNGGCWDSFTHIKIIQR